jgi:hypothetical protein
MGFAAWVWDLAAKPGVGMGAHASLIPDMLAPPQFIIPFFSHLNLTMGASSALSS